MYIYGPVVLARNLLLSFNTDEQKYFNCRMQPLIFLVWQRGTAQSRQNRPPRYCGNTKQDKTQNLWY